MESFPPLPINSFVGLVERRHTDAWLKHKGDKFPVPPFTGSGTRCHGRSRKLCRIRVPFHQKMSTRTESASSPLTPRNDKQVFFLKLRAQRSNLNRHSENRYNVLSQTAICLALDEGPSRLPNRLLYHRPHPRL